MAGVRRSTTLLIGAVLALQAAGGTAHATFTQEPGSPYTVGAAPFGVVTQDLNADARPDAGVVNGTSSDVSVFLRQAGGGFAEELGSPSGVGVGPIYAAVADFNVDTRPDLAVGNFVDGSVSVLLRQAGGGFAQEAGSPISIGTRVGAVAAGDFNGDTRPDLAVTTWDTGTVRILLRQPGGGFVAEGSPSTTGLNPRYIAVAEFNGDGRPDLAVTNFGSASVTVLLRQAGGGFAQEGRSPVGVGSAPFSVVADDLNADGRADLTVTNSGSATLSILLRGVGGGFSAELGLASGDFNSDGRRDLAVANNGPSNVGVLLRAAGGAFTTDPSSPLPISGAPSGVGVADFDGDGRADLAVTSGSNSLSILLNTTPRPSPPPPSGPVSPAAPQCPRIINLRLVSRAVTARVGLRISFRLNVEAAVNATVDHKLRGRRVRGRCAPRAKRGKRCQTFKAIRRHGSAVSAPAGTSCGFAPAG